MTASFQFSRSRNESLYVAKTAGFLTYQMLPEQLNRVAMHSMRNRQVH